MCIVYTVQIKHGRSSRRQLRVSASIPLLKGSMFMATTWHIRAEKEHGNAEDRLAISVREHSDTGTDDKSVVGHLLLEFLRR